MERAGQEMERAGQEMERAGQEMERAGQGGDVATTIPAGVWGTFRPCQPGPLSLPAI